MTNPLLETKLAERASQVAFIDELLTRVDADGRDMVETEQSTMRAAQETIAGLDAQLELLTAFERDRAKHADAQAYIAPPNRRDGPVPLGAGRRDVQYDTAGAFLVDYIAGRGLLTDGRGARLPADQAALERVNYVLANQTTADTPGLLPHTIVGGVVNLIDATRPFITGNGGTRPMGGIPGKTFGRPKVTQHTQAGPQSAEKAELPSRKMTIGEIAFTKATFGGAVDVSRQDIDWSSPAAWDILIRDLADVYAMETENAAADDFVAKADDVNAATPVATADLEGWAAALYTAAGLIYGQAKKLPDRLFVSTDVWANTGPIIDLQLASVHGFGASDVSSFAGNMLTLPRIVVPSFPAATAILAAPGSYEVYEEVIGLLTAVEPSLLGVEVAYGGYIAYNAVAPEGLAMLTPAAGPLSAARSRSKE